MPDIARRHLGGPRRPRRAPRRPRSAVTTTWCWRSPAAASSRRACWPTGSTCARSSLPAWSSTGRRAARIRRRSSATSRMRRCSRGRRVLVVDEVWETGETMTEVLARVRVGGRDARVGRDPLQARPVSRRGRPRPLGGNRRRLGDLPVQGGRVTMVPGTVPAAPHPEGWTPMTAPEPDVPPRPGPRGRADRHRRPGRRRALVSLLPAVRAAARVARVADSPASHRRGSGTRSAGDLDDGSRGLVDLRSRHVRGLPGPRGTCEHRGDGGRRPHVGRDRLAHDRRDDRHARPTITADLTTLQSDSDNRDRQLSRQALETANVPEGDLHPDRSRSSWARSRRRGRRRRDGHGRPDAPRRDEVRADPAPGAAARATRSTSLARSRSRSPISGSSKPSAMVVLSVADNGVLELLIHFTR